MDIRESSCVMLKAIGSSDPCSSYSFGSKADFNQHNQFREARDGKLTDKVGFAFRCFGDRDRILRDSSFLEE